MFAKITSDYNNIIEICNSGQKIQEILKRIKGSVNDVHSITADHFINAVDDGINHFYLLLK